MALCLEGSVIFTRHGKNQCRNLVNVTNVLISINLPSQHFLAATLDFTSFFPMAFLGDAQFFTAGLFLD